VDVLDVLRVCLRRWYVFLPLIILALGAGFGLASQQKPTYTAFGSYALVFNNTRASTSSGHSVVEENPLGANGAALLGEALAADFMAGQSQIQFGGVGNSGSAPGQPTSGNTFYSVSLPQNSEAYLVQTWGKDPDEVRRVVNSVLAAAPVRATEIQDRAGAPRRSYYTVFVTSTTQVAELPPTSKVKLLVAVLGLGLLAGSALSLVVDRIVRSRKEKRVLNEPAGARRPAEEVEMTNSLNASPSDSRPLQISATHAERLSTVQNPALTVIDSGSGMAVDAPMPGSSVARSMATAAQPGRGERHNGPWDKPALASGAADSVDGAEGIDERIVETWTLPPWAGQTALGQVTDSGVGVEVHIQSKRVASHMAIEDSAHQEQHGPSDLGEIPNEINGRPAQGGVTRRARTVNGAESNSDAEIWDRQYT
jgi:hypothetical protein